MEDTQWIPPSHILEPNAKGRAKSHHVKARHELM